MRADEFVGEMAGEIHGGIRQVLRDKGYQYLGSGIDKQAWLEPTTGQVLLIIGYRKGVEGFSPDQRMFIDWVRYCEQHQNNPNLPKFSGFESFEFQGKSYIQARMEPLQELPRQLKELVTYVDIISHYIDAGLDSAIEQLAQRGYYDEVKNKFNKYTAAQVIKYLGGRSAAENLIITTNEVREFGEQHGYHLDLHGGNYMQRSNGTIVVNDPFVIWSGGSFRLLIPV